MSDKPKDAGRYAPVTPIIPLQQSPVPESAPQEDKKPSRLWVRWLIFGGIALGIVLLLVWFLASSSGLFQTKTEAQPLHLSFDTFGTSSYDLSGDRLCRATQTGVTIYDTAGAVTAQVQGSFPTPYLLGCDASVLACGIGGTDVKLLTPDGAALLQLTTSGPIYDAALASDGSASILYSGADSRATLEVYSAKGALLFRRSSKTLHFNTCAISEGGAFAAATSLSQAEITFVTTVQIFRTTQEEIYAELSLGNQMIYDMAFLDEDTLCAVGETSIQIFNVEGETLQEYPLSDGALLCYDFGQGLVSFACDLYETGDNCRLVCLGADGVQAKTVLDSAVTALSMSGDCLAVLQNFDAALYNTHLEPQWQVRLDVAYSDIEARDDGTAYLIAESAAELYIP